MELNNKLLLILENFEYQKVISSNVDIVGYDPETSILSLEFKDGGVYNYFDVPINVFRNLKRAASKGKFCHRRIYPFYDYEKVK